MSRGMASRRVAAVSGVLAAGAALATGELVAGWSGRVPSLVVAVAGAVRDFAPRWFVEFGIETFGPNDKRALIVGTLVAAGVISMGMGIAARRWRTLGVAVLAGFGVLGGFAAARQSGVSAWASALSAGLSVLVGVVALLGLLWLAPRQEAAREGSMSFGDLPDRRAFLAVAGAFTTLAAFAAAGGRFAARQSSAAVARARVLLPRPADPAPGIPVEASFGGVRGLSTLVTLNGRFYRVDTALEVPGLDLESWRLRVRGKVTRTLELTYAEVLALPMVERHVTLACVSNPVGGDLLGTARWLGVPIADLLDRAGVHSDATQIVGRALDGFTAGFPTALARDGRSALVAVGMNGEPLPLSHGFPARLVVAGLYGYESATKWLGELELTTLQAFEGYWPRRGWAKEVAIKTQSRIDAPQPYAVLETGTVTVAGVAWAPTRGISGVEVQVDDGQWEAADLASAVNPETWRQWRWLWRATPGRHLLRVRATDGSQRVQSGMDRPPIPDGATGYDIVAVTVHRR